MAADRTPSARVRHVLAGAALALAAAGHAHAELVPLAWDAAGRFERSFELAPGKFAEACGKLLRGEVVRWSYEASAPLDFNIHYHLDGDKVEYPERKEGAARAQATLAVGADQDYCWMWTNPTGAPVSLQLRLARGRPAR